MIVSCYGTRANRPFFLSASRHWPLAPALIVALFAASSASGQRLLELGPSIEDAAAAEEGFETFAIDLDVDFVRSAPRRVELPTPDGRVLAAELTVFEDRGAGDAMWAGAFPGAGYESVVLTIKDGYLAGRFGVPGGAAYLLSVGPDGRGRMEDTSTREPDPREERCPDGVIPSMESPVGVPLAQQAGPPRGVASESNHDVLDVLVVYTAESEERWSRRNLTPGAAIQRSMDYLAQVFRNGQLGVTPNLVHFEEAPPLYADHEAPEGGEESEWSCGHVLGHMPGDPDLARLRAEHQADMVHLFVWGLNGCSGIAYLLTKGVSAQGFSGAAFGLTLPRGDYDGTFAHEIGHNMGANHDPQNVGLGNRTFEQHRNEVAVYPYAYGHTDFLPIPNIDTIMSYGSGGVEPYFSTVRISPRGWTLGIAGERENERAMQQTIHLAVQYSDFIGSAPPPDPEPPPPPPPPGEIPTAPANLTVTPTGATSVRLTWSDESDNENGFEVQLRPAGGRWQAATRLPANTTSADVTGLDAGGRYDFRVRAYNRVGGANSGIVTVVLQAAEFTDCVPSAPQISFEHGYTVSMCIEYEKDGETVQADAVDYGLGSRESGLLYFFDRDNSEVLIKVLDACRVNGHRWVFVAPVTTLAFNLRVDETATGEYWEHKNPRGGETATTKSDITAFPCGSAASASTVADGGEDFDAIDGVDLVDAGFPLLPAPSTASTAVDPAPQSPVSVSLPVIAGGEAECEPQPVRELRGGYTVNMCVEHLKEDETVVEVVRDYELDSEQSAILYFFDRNNAEVLIKVLDGCGINGHRWVFVAPVTTLAFNLSITPPDGGTPWTHQNRLNQTAAAKSDIKAFACAN